MAEEREGRVVVRGADLAISSSSPARHQGAAGGSRPCPRCCHHPGHPHPAQVVRSREEILALATSRLSLAPPAGWARLVKALPSVVVRAKVEDRGDTTATNYPPPLFPTNPSF